MHILTQSAIHNSIWNLFLFSTTSLKAVIRRSNRWLKLEKSMRSNQSIAAYIVTLTKDETLKKTFLYTKNDIISFSPLYQLFFGNIKVRVYFYANHIHHAFLSPPTF